ncbi:MAG TPA: bifunctional riboflavin kinase/FAD synthetase [Alphaproteobacteria bacterium]|nr:bifunctional riboflavin kinase/FAD synthetase [Alphaproteobacteria bacterium]
MRVFRHYTDLPAASQGSIVAIGNFDGVHRGHQAVIGEAVRRAKAAGRASGVLTFEPHPRRFFKPDTPPFLLTRLRTKVRVLAAIGVDNLFVLRFNASLAGLSAETFIDRVLVDGLRAHQVVVGYDFVFGQGRRGNPELLRERLAARGIATMVMPPVAAPHAEPDGDSEGLIYSSTGVRDALRAGDPRAAARLLGRPFEIEGRVRRGDARGRLLGFPTANIWLGDYLRPALGVYAVQARIDNGSAQPLLTGVANLGLRPTFGGSEPRLEVHLFDFQGDLYGHRLRVELIEFLRPERKFDGIEPLKAQIAADVQAAKAALAKSLRPAPSTPKP